LLVFSNLWDAVRAARSLRLASFNLLSKILVRLFKLTIVLFAVPILKYGTMEYRTTFSSVINNNSTILKRTMKKYFLNLIATVLFAYGQQMAPVTLSKGRWS